MAQDSRSARTSSEEMGRRADGAEVVLDVAAITREEGRTDAAAVMEDFARTILYEGLEAAYKKMRTLPQYQLPRAVEARRFFNEAVNANDATIVSLTGLFQMNARDQEMIPGRTNAETFQALLTQIAEYTGDVPIEEGRLRIVYPFPVPAGHRPKLLDAACSSLEPECPPQIAIRMLSFWRSSPQNIESVIRQHAGLSQDQGPRLSEVSPA